MPAPPGRPTTLGQATRRACRKHGAEGKKLLRNLAEGRGKAREQPQTVHKLRVAFRREATLLDRYQKWTGHEDAALQQYGESIRYVTKRFGRVRDLDVSKQNLLAAAKVADGLGKKEKKAVKKIAAGLQEERCDAMQKVVRKGLGKKVLKSVYKGSSVLKDGRLDAQSAAALDVRGAAVVPMLTLPLWSEVLLHPAWHSDPFGADLEASGEVIAMTEQMHDLRKTIRELRYITDLVKPYAGDGTGPASRKTLNQLIQWQETLGDMHDLQVLHDQLHTYDIDRFPAITRSVERRYIAKALAWQQIRGDMLEQGMERDYSLLVEPATRSAALGTPSIPPPAAEPVEPVSVTVEDDLQATLVPELKRRLRERGLPVSGRMAELVARLSRCQQAWRAGAQAVADKAVETLRWVGEP